MQVLLINGSPHKEGCTYTALAEVAGALSADGIGYEILHIGHGPIAGCAACGHCKTAHRCVYDDLVNRVIDRLGQFDGFVFGAPVHYAGIAGGMKSFLDRLFYAAADELLDYKPVGVVVSCRRGGSSASYDQLIKYPGIHRMPIVSSHYWNMVHGNTPEEVLQDLEGMQTMRILGHNMAWLLRCIEAGKEAGIPLPVSEPKVRTNFIR